MLFSWADMYSAFDRRGGCVRCRVNDAQVKGQHSCSWAFTHFPMALPCLGTDKAVSTVAGGRPRIEIDTEEFVKLCAIQCTLDEIAGFFNCSPDTVERWCKRELKLSFAEAFKKHSAGGRMSLRRAQFKLAETNTTMAIWLGKQYLGQKDSPDTADPAALKQAREILEGVDSAID